MPTIVASADTVIRNGGVGDLPFLRRMLVEAAYWRQAEKPSVIDGLRPAHLAKLLDGWGRAGDRAVIAEVEGRAVGAAWYRLWTRESYSYGYVADTVPELAIGVAEDVRGLGIGRRLMEALVATAYNEGLAALSLSVERDNPALRLYRNSGFEVVASNGGALTMLLRIK